MFGKFKVDQHLVGLLEAILFFYLRKEIFSPPPLYKRFFLQRGTPQFLGNFDNSLTFLGPDDFAFVTRITNESILGKVHFIIW